MNRKISVIYDRLLKCYGPQGWWPGDSRLEIIVGAILTQNTAWSNVEKAIANLKKARALSSPDPIHRMTSRRLSGLIRPAGYYNVKARRLKNFFRFLHGSYGGSLARMTATPTEKLREELLGVNGIGPETCDSILLYAFKRPVFVIDAYTKRVFSRHKLCRPDTDYAALQTFFTRNLPEDARLFNEYHALIVRLGKERCRTRPLCGTCPLRKRGLTPFSLQKPIIDNIISKIRLRNQLVIE